ncbi:MAG: hypothetical protein QOE63_40 [Acidimicrobiaceae bacterium]
MTFSIVARDPETGQLGVAVETCMFAVGGIVPWARAGVGAVATQAIAEMAHGPRCLDAMADGATAAAALEGSLAADPLAALRQVGVVDASGTASASTGELCIDHAGHIAGEGFSVQGNMLASTEVWPAMADAYESASGTFAWRLLAALQAGEVAGGDARGRMSAAMVIVDGAVFPDASGGTWLDLRVDEDDDPIGALGHLLDTQGAFTGFNDALGLLLGGDPAGAVATIEGALAVRPHEGNLRSLYAAALAASGRTDEATAIMRGLVAERASWAVVLRSFMTKGLLPAPEGVDIDAILDGR